MKMLQCNRGGPRALALLGLAVILTLASCKNASDSDDAANWKDDGTARPGTATVTGDDGKPIAVSVLGTWRLEKYYQNGEDYQADDNDPKYEDGEILTLTASQVKFAEGAVAVKYGKKDGTDYAVYSFDPHDFDETAESETVTSYLFYKIADGMLITSSGEKLTSAENTHSVRVYSFVKR